MISLKKYVQGQHLHPKTLPIKSRSQRKGMSWEWLDFLRVFVTSWLTCIFGDRRGPITRKLGVNRDRHWGFILILPIRLPHGQANSTQYG